MKKVSIIIPAFNAHKTIIQTISSILYQDVNKKDLEIIIVNDNPKDTYDKEINLFNNYVDIKEIINEKNVGPGKSREKGVYSATGKYIIFIDSDDVFRLPTSISLMISTIEKEKGDYLTSPILCETPDGFMFINDREIWHHGKVYRRKFIVDNKLVFPNEPIHEDSPFNQLVLLHNPKEINLGESTYIWRKTNGSLTRNENFSLEKTYTSYLNNMADILETATNHKCNEYNVSKIAYDSLINAYLTSIAYSLDRKELKVSLRKVLKYITKEIREEDKKEIMNNQYNNFSGLLTMGDILSAPQSLSDFYKENNNID